MSAQKVNPWAPPEGRRHLLVTAVTPKAGRHQQARVWNSREHGSRPRLVAALVRWKGVFEIFRLPEPGPQGEPQFRFIPPWSKGGYIIRGTDGVRLNELVERGDL